MNQDQSPQTPAAPYPGPPPFWQYFTTENAKRIKDLAPSAGTAYDLNFLCAPPPPSRREEFYTTFAMPVKLDPVPALPPAEILLFDPNSAGFNHARALKQLTNSLLLNFLELATVLANDSVKYEEKMQDIERLMLNVHFVINLYRPHQAREGVKEMLQGQLVHGREEIESLNVIRQRVDAFLKMTEKQSKLGIDANEVPPEMEAENNRKLWNSIHNLNDD